MLRNTEIIFLSVCVYQYFMLCCISTRVVNGSQSKREKRRFNYLRSSVVDCEYFRLSTVPQWFVNGFH